MDLLFQLYKIISKSGAEEQMKSFVLDNLKDVELTVSADEIGNLFLTKGVADIYPCVAAHLDEIHDPCEREIVVDGDVIYTVDKLGNKVGCGADDKNGLWVILNLLRSESVLKVALFVQEERDGDLAGCRGARACNLSFFDNVRYVLECDRKGASDVVSIGKGDVVLCKDDFIPQYVLMKYGYEFVPGGKTDVVELKIRGLGIPVCNISCGYYNAHKNDEYTKFSELENCLDFVKTVIHTI